jgi:hypothetical protein
MRFILTLAILALLFSCNWTSSKEEKIVQNDDSWQLSDRTATLQTYTSTNLLDTSFKTIYFYTKGNFFDSINSIVVRHYDNDKLTDTKDYTVAKDGSKKLSSEIIKKFDAIGNMILEAHKFDNDIVYKSTKLYNDKRQLVRSVNIMKKEDVDSDRNIKFHYDTSISNFFYDERGNQISSIITDIKGKNIGTTMSQYSGHDKTFSCRINAQGDTTSKSIYSTERGLVKEVSEMKEIYNIDTIWLDKEKITKIIGYNYKKKTKHKTTITYNDKGDEIENISYH